MNVVSIGRPYRPPPAPPAPRLCGETLPDDSIPQLCLSTSIAILAAEMRRIRLMHGDDMVFIAIDEARKVMLTTSEAAP